MDLQAEFPDSKGFSARNLWFMKQVVSVLMFLTCFAYVPWGHHVMIMLCNITPKRIINSPIIEGMVIASLST